jgi:hypothetical protein
MRTVAATAGSAAQVPKYATVIDPAVVTLRVTIPPRDSPDVLSSRFPSSLTVAGGGSAHG